MKTTERIPTPKRGRRISAFIAAGLALAAGGVLLLHFKTLSSPLLHGQPLEYWDLRVRFQPGGSHEARLEAEQAIREAGPESVLFLAHAALSPPSLRQRVVDSFWTHCAPRLPRKWVSKLNPPNMRLTSPIPRLALIRLSELGPEAEKAAPAVIRVMNRTNDFHRRLAAECLGNIGVPDERTVRALIRAARDDHHVPLRISAVEALGKIGNQSAAIRPALLAMRDESDPGVLFALGRTLRELEQSPANAIPLFFRVLRSDDSRLSWVVVQTLEEIGLIDGVPGLVEALQENAEPRVRARAATALGNLGPIASEARPALERAAAEDEYLMVRNAARQALTLMKTGHPQ